VFKHWLYPLIGLRDWRLMTMVIEALRATLPDAAARPPGEVAEFLINAIRSYQAKTIEPA
jgi:hypothetical protein